MAKKVKVQLETEISDIPKFCSLNLSESEKELDDAYNAICMLRADLKQSTLEDVKVCLAKIEKIRTGMGKTDATLADIFGILMGYVQLMEKTEESAEDKKESI